MKRVWQCYRSIVGGHIEDFLAHKRGTGRKFDSEERALQLFDRFIFEKRLNSINEITSALIEEFLKSRPRPRPRSFNHLLCTISRLFDWMMNRGITPFSPVQAFPRRQGAERRPYIFDLPKAQLLIEAAKKLPDNPRAPMRGPTYHAIFAILYGLGLRVGEVCRLRVKDLDFERRLLVVRRSKFYKSRLVPFGPKWQHFFKIMLLKKRRRK
jgi:site-specific recombinase XerD